MTTTLFAKADVSPGFNHGLAEKAARQVYENWHDPAYRHGLMMALGAHVSDLLFEHHDELQEMLDIAAARESAKLKRAVAKAYVKTAYGEVIYKATRSDPDEEKKHPHGAGGRFINSNWRPNINISWHGREPMAQEQRAQQMARVGNVLASGKGPNQFSLDAGGQVMDVAHALGANADQAGSAGAIAAHLHHQLISQGTYDPRTGAYRPEHDLKRTWGQRLVDASHALFHLFGGNRGRGAYLVGKFVGTHGQAAVNALGPRFRRMFYRYKGSEQPVNVPMRAKTAKGGEISTEAYEKVLATHLAKEPKPDGSGGLGAIPDLATARLALQSGRTVPSQGFILNKDGKVVSQAIGFGDDHYLPFNLKKLPNMENGSYVRSRTFGGPTTEDIHLAIVSGAKRATVTSRFGTYTVHFQGKANKGLARFGTVQRAIVNRYGRLLDAVKSGRVTNVGTAGGAQGQASRLNAQGYVVALDALKHQFPQYIKSVEYTPWDRQSVEHVATADEVDHNYIRPGAVQPYEAIVGGLFDPHLPGNDPRRNLKRGTGETFTLGGGQQGGGGGNAGVSQAGLRAATSSLLEGYGEMALRAHNKQARGESLTPDEAAALNQADQRKAAREGLDVLTVRNTRLANAHREIAGGGKSQTGREGSAVALGAATEKNQRGAQFVNDTVFDAIVDDGGEWHGDDAELPPKEINGEPNLLRNVIDDIRKKTDNGTNQENLAHLYNSHFEELYSDPEYRRNLADSLMENEIFDLQDLPRAYGHDFEEHMNSRWELTDDQKADVSAAVESEAKTGAEHPEEGFGERSRVEDVEDEFQKGLRAQYEEYPDLLKAYNRAMDAANRIGARARARAEGIRNIPEADRTVEQLEELQNFNHNRDRYNELQKEYVRLRHQYFPNGVEGVDF